MGREGHVGRRPSGQSREPSRKEISLCGLEMLVRCTEGLACLGTFVVVGAAGCRVQWRCPPAATTSCRGPWGACRGRKQRRSWGSTAGDVGFGQPQAQPHLGWDRGRGTWPSPAPAGNVNSSAPPSPTPCPALPASELYGASVRHGTAPGCEGDVCRGVLVRLLAREGADCCTQEWFVAHPQSSASVPWA